MPKIRLSVYGARGRMGRAVVEAADKHPDFTLFALVDSADSDAQGSDAQGRVAQDEPPVTVTHRLPNSGFDCLIDFSNAQASKDLVARLLEGSHHPALVIGTTGHDAEFEQMLSSLAEKCPIVRSPNMSIGVNLCYHLVREATKVLGDQADIEIIDVHHRHKVDAPSGTALEFGRVICRQLGYDPDTALVCQRSGHIGSRPDKTIGISTVRAGEVVGDHTVMLATDNEHIIIKHTAQNRKNFADGAIRAAQWLMNNNQSPRAPGLYSMTDVLGFPAI